MSAATLLICDGCGDGTEPVAGLSVDRIREVAADTLGWRTSMAVGFTSDPPPHFWIVDLCRKCDEIEGLELAL